MKIIIKPSDIIERCLWDKYYRFCLKNNYNKEEVKKIVAENKEFEISEKDAFVIGLLNCIYTPDLIYKLNQLLKSDLENKSTIIDNRLHINRDLLVDSATNFLLKFPDFFKSDKYDFNLYYNKLDKIIQLFIFNLNNLETTKFKDALMVKCKQVKKLINEIIIEY